MSRLDDIAHQIARQSNPPVDKWQPEHVGAIDIAIDAQGHWFHEGDPIVREDLAKLFSSILWHENGTHYLLTPAEKLAIRVADVPFVVHQLEQADGHWVATTNMHEQLIIGPEHPVQLREYGDSLVPYVRVRFDLWARLNRALYYQWVTAAMELQASEDAPLLLSSGDYEFEVAR